MPTISRLSVNSSLAIPSKHFFKWGCTRRGSFVSDKISSSSSFDRKKNLFQSKGRWQLESAENCFFQEGDTPQQEDDTWVKTSYVSRVFSKAPLPSPFFTWDMKGGDGFDFESKRKHECWCIWVQLDMDSLSGVRTWLSGTSPLKLPWLLCRRTLILVGVKCPIRT